MAKGWAPSPQAQACWSSHARSTGRDGKQDMWQTFATSSGLETTGKRGGFGGLAPPAAYSLGHSTLLSSLVSCRQFCRLPPGGGGFNVSGAAIGEAEIGFRPIKLLRHPALSSVTHKLGVLPLPTCSRSSSPLPHSLTARVNSKLPTTPKGDKQAT